MKALTTSQQEIIDNLLKEFHGMNEVNPIPFTLFNAQPILNILNEKEIESKEISLHNKAMNGVLMGKLNDYIDVLNNDFNHAGLLIKAHYGNLSIVIGGDSDKVVVCHSFNVSLYVRQMQSSTKHGFTKVVGYKYSHDYNCDEKYDTIEALINSDIITKKMTRLIEESRKKGNYYPKK